MNISEWRSLSTSYCCKSNPVVSPGKSLTWAHARSCSHLEMQTLTSYTKCVWRCFSVRAHSPLILFFRRVFAVDYPTHWLCDVRLKTKVRSPQVERSQRTLNQESSEDRWRLCSEEAANLTFRAQTTRPQRGKNWDGEVDRCRNGECRTQKEKQIEKRLCRHTDTWENVGGVSGCRVRIGVWKWGGDVRAQFLHICMCVCKGTYQHIDERTRLVGVVRPSIWVNVGRWEDKIGTGRPTRQTYTYLQPLLYAFFSPHWGFFSPPST